MEKIVNKIKQTRFNWWEAFKLSIRLKGYQYYKPPPEIRFRYPAPGSSPQSYLNKPQLYKPHYKTSYRDHPYNIRKIDVPENRPEKRVMSEVPVLNLQDPVHVELNKGPLPNTDGIKQFEFLPVEEARKEFQLMFEKMREEKAGLSDTFAPWHWGYDDDYNPFFMNYNDRGATGFENQPLAKQTFLEFERLIEEVFNYHRKRDQVMHMYKGVTKKWQILDDSFDIDEIRKIQIAAKAPSPEELDNWSTKNKPMKLPINNDNVHEWRDERSAIESADFNPRLVEVDRERNQQFYLKRYEKPTEIAEH